MKNVMIVVFLAFVSIFFVSCGGEGPDDPIDTDQIDNNEPVDEDLTDNESIDDSTDETTDDDILIDNEPTDDDTTPITCDQDETCKEICKNFLNMEGSWSVVEPTTVSGEIDLTLSINGENCKIAVTGKWDFVWEGTEISQCTCVEYSPIYSFFSLQEMEEGRLIIKKSSTEEVCENGQGATYKFEKIQ